MTTVNYDLKPCDKTLQAAVEREKQRQKDVAKKKLKWEKKLRKSGRIDDEKPTVQRKPGKEYADRGMNAPRKADKATEKFTKFDMADVYLACGLTPAPRPCPPPLPKIKRDPSRTR